MKNRRLNKTIKLMKANPKIRASEVAEKIKTTVNYAYQLMAKARYQFELDDAATEQLVDKMAEEANAHFEAEERERRYLDEAKDEINHPNHYKLGGIETIDFIEAKNLNYCLGNVVKYISRAELKGDRMQNLKKAQWYLNREIEKSL